MSVVDAVKGSVCIVHAGTEKTGSTSLQRFLALNDRILAERKVWVPRALVLNPDRSPFNHLLISTASRLSIRKPDDLQTMLGLSSMGEVHRHREEIIQALEREYRQLGFVPSTIIVSNEHIHSRLRLPEDLAHARALLAPYCDAFKVFVYLRPQAELAHSLATTSVRNGKTEFRPIPDFSAPNGFDPVLGVDFGYFDYAALTERLAKIFGDSALRVRLYETTELHEKNIIDDFFFEVGLDISGLKRPGRENPGLNREGVLFLAYLNRYLDQNVEAQRAVRTRLISFLDKNYAGSMPPAEISRQNAFMQKFLEGNAIVKQRWFAERKALFRLPELPSAQEPEAFSLNMDEAFKLFLHVFADQVPDRQRVVA